MEGHYYFVLSNGERYTFDTYERAEYFLEHNRLYVVDTNFVYVW